MLEWCLAHPFMTFFIVLVGLMALEGIVESISKIFRRN